MSNQNMMELSRELDAQFDYLVETCMKSGEFNQDLYTEYDVKRGLRDANGKGVLTGLTEVSDVCGYEFKNGMKYPADGILRYQGYNVKDMVKGYQNQRYEFEETTYLLIFGELPDKKQLESFKCILSDLQELSGQFVRDVVMKAPSANLMNGLQKSVLGLYSYDENPDDISVPNVLRQSLQLIAKMPLLAVYSYETYQHLRLNKTMLIRVPEKEKSTAENILYMLREDGQYTELEAKVLDIALVLHAEHGGGNNSTFTNHVVTSTGTDTYSAVAASIGSLKGPKHGGANLKVLQMFDDLKNYVTDWNNEKAISDYLENTLSGKTFDHSGLIYGMGHAVYTISDPRAVILKEFAMKLAEEKGRMEEFRLYEKVELIAKDLITKNRMTFKPICANVDFYSGLVYTMLNIPRELFTPIFAIARISGWSAHRLEELVNDGKIIRPAYKYVGTKREYQDIDER